MTVYKKILHFNTINNVSKFKNPYDQCILNLRTTYRNIRKITLKSAEISVKKDTVLNGIDENLNYAWAYVIDNEETWVSMNKIIKNNDTLDNIIVKMNEQVALQLKPNTSIVFYKEFSGYVSVEIIGFETENVGLHKNSKLLQLLGYDPLNEITNDPVIKEYDAQNDATYITFNSKPFSQSTSSSNYVCIYLSNIPSTGSSNADGSPCSFKIPLSNFKVSDTGDFDSFFYNEQSNYTQSVEVQDKHFVLTNLNISLYNAYNQIFSASVLLNWSFTVEIEYIGF